MIISGQSFSGQVGVPFSQTIARSGTIEEWWATDLPPGLSINATTGVVSGVPTFAVDRVAYISARVSDMVFPGTVSFEILPAEFPIFRGSTRATAIFAGATEGKAIYYGSKLLWNVAGWEPSRFHQILDSLATTNPADGARGHSRFAASGLNLGANNLTRVGFKFAGGVRIKNAIITTGANTYEIGVATNFNLVRYFTTHDLTITADGIGRSGFGDLGGGWVVDMCGFWLDIPAGNVTGSNQIIVDYELIGGNPSKHGVGFWATSTTVGQGPNENYIGTWDNVHRAILPNTTTLTPIAVTPVAGVGSNTLYRRRVVIQNTP